MKTKLTLSLLLSLFFSSGLLAQTTMSLAEAQKYAVEHAFAVKNARLDAAMAEREVKETLTIGLPQISGSLEYNNFIDIPTQVAQGDVFGFPTYLTEFLGGVSQETGVALNAPETDPNAISEFQFGADQTATAGLSASQLLFDGSYFVGVQASKAYAAAMQESISRSESSTKAAVAQAYHGVLIARENVRVLTKSVEVLRRSVIETEAMYNEGFMEEMDVDQLTLSLRDLESRIQYASQQASLAMSMLKFQIGLPLNADLELSDSVESLADVTVGSSLLSMPFNLQQNYDFRVQSKYVDLAELGVKNQKAKALPSIGAFYSYQRNAQRFGFDFFDFNKKWYPTQLWGVQMTIPIFGSTMGYQRIQKAKIDLERAEAALEQIATGAELEYAAAKLEYENASRQRELQSQSLALAEKIFNKTQIKYNEGLASSFELSQTQNQLLLSQGNYINSTLQLLNAGARLKQALSNY
ncbi:MAG: hypothetical protein GC193_04350 [Cryomorphaceae bacterium]|nr:hypothetical protein [Cryomorphaceae bacterium]